MPKISVIIPVYNVEPYLKRSLDSLINQTLKDIEIILINDCSTDNSLSILKEYAGKDERIKLINLETNQGAAVARNKGLEQAKKSNPEYLGFIDPDDDIDLNYYEELYKKAKEEDYDIVKCQRKTIDTDGNVKLGLVNERIINSSIYSFTYEWTTAIYKSSIIFDNNINFPPEIRKAQDVVFLNKVVLKSKTIAVIDNVFYYYYKREDSLNAKKISIDKIKSALMAHEAICNNLNNVCNYLGRETYIKRYVVAINTILLFTSRQNDTKEAKKMCIEKLFKIFKKCKYIEGVKKCYEDKGLIDVFNMLNNNKKNELLSFLLNIERFGGYKNYLRLLQLKNNIKKDMNNA